MIFGRNLSDRQIIRALEKRLQWYMNEATHEEFNSKEVTAIVDLLQEMDPIEKRESDFFTAPKANGRFWAFYVFKRNYDDKPPYDNMFTRAMLKVRRFIYGNAFARISFVAMLLVAIMFGGTLAVFAQREGYFHWVNEDEKERLAITVPNQDIDSTEQLYYRSLDDVPIKYLKYVWIPKGLASDCELQEIYIYNDSKTVKVESRFLSSEAKFIKFTKKEYGSATTVTSHSFDLFEQLNTQEVEEIEVTYLKKINDDYIEYMATFCIDNAIYYVNTNGEVGDIKIIVNNSIKELKEGM